jgi:hypothetical protein
MTLILFERSLSLRGIDTESESKSKRDSERVVILFSQRLMGTNES